MREFRFACGLSDKQSMVAEVRSTVSEGALQSTVCATRLAPFGRQPEDHSSSLTFQDGGGFGIGIGIRIRVRIGIGILFLKHLERSAGECSAFDLVFGRLVVRYWAVASCRIGRAAPAHRIEEPSEKDLREDHPHPELSGSYLEDLAWRHARRTKKEPLR